LGFDADNKIQTTPRLIPGLKKIKQISCGDNHVLALDDKGSVFSWGSGQQNQLGRRIVERTRLHGLEPRQFGLPKGVVHVACGSFHSFAIHKNGKVYGWGLNSFGETGVDEGAGDDEAAILHPTVIKSLGSKNVTQISGGGHHSMAVTDSGECLVWGRCDGAQTGFKIDTIPDSDVVKDDRGRPRILITPSVIPDLEAAHVSAGPDHSLAVGKDGRIWSWGFSVNYQTGQGTDEDIDVATVVENTAVRGKKLTWAGAGGQFSVFTTPVETLTNGTT
jgi:regulator of chromosome condensation